MASKTTTKTTADRSTWTWTSEDLTDPRATHDEAGRLEGGFLMAYPIFMGSQQRLVGRWCHLLYKGSDFGPRIRQFQTTDQIR